MAMASFIIFLPCNGSVGGGALMAWKRVIQRKDFNGFLFPKRFCFRRAMVYIRCGQPPPAPKQVIPSFWTLDLPGGVHVNDVYLCMANCGFNLQAICESGPKKSLRPNLQIHRFQMEQTIDSVCDSRIAWWLVTSMKIVCANETPVHNQPSNTDDMATRRWFWILQSFKIPSQVALFFLQNVVGF